MAEQRSVVVVDPYLAGRGIAAAFAGRGVQAIAVLTTPEPPAGLAATWQPDDYREVHVLHDLDELALKLAVHDVLAVVPGAETGVETAELLSELIVPGRSNVLALSSTRRDRWQLAVALRVAGIPHLRRVSTDSTHEVAGWMAREGLGLSPIVLQPHEGGGADDVVVAMPGDDWQAVFDRILVRDNRVLVQELVAGTEYEVHTFSADGRHGLAAVWRHTGENRGIDLSTALVPPADPVVPALFAHVCEVLDATGVRNGPAHAEVVVTPSGPRLIGISAHPAGAEQQELTLLGTGANQLTRMVRHHVDGDTSVGTYEQQLFVKSVHLSSPRAGVLRNAAALASLDTLLPSFHRSFVRFGEGSSVPRTTDPRTSLGYIALAHDDEKQVERDEAQLRSIQASFEIV